MASSGSSDRGPEDRAPLGDPGAGPPAGRRTRRWARTRETVVVVAIALALSVLIQTFVAKPFVIPSGSMERTLHGCVGCNNDRVLVDRVTYRFSDPRPGDIVVFRGPAGWTTEAPAAESNPLTWAAGLVGLGPASEEDFVKRVIAVGGQTVQCCDATNRVLVDGVALDEPYVFYEPGSDPVQQPFGPVTVPEGQLWMMGDHRNNSADSRVPGHGPVPVADVLGRARAIILPLDRLGWLPDAER